MKTRKILFTLILALFQVADIVHRTACLNRLMILCLLSHKTGYVTGTFKALYIVNMKTIEAPAAGALNLEIQHRFGTVNSGCL